MLYVGCLIIMKGQNTKKNRCATPRHATPHNKYSTINTRQCRTRQCRGAEKPQQHAPQLTATSWGLEVMNLQQWTHGSFALPSPALNTTPCAAPSTASARAPEMRFPPSAAHERLQESPRQTSRPEMSRGRGRDCGAPLGTVRRSGRRFSAVPR